MKVKELIEKLIALPAKCIDYEVCALTDCNFEYIIGEYDHISPIGKIVTDDKEEVIVISF